MTVVLNELFWVSKSLFLSDLATFTTAHFAILGLKCTKYIPGLVELVSNNSSKCVRLHSMEILTNARKKNYLKKQLLKFSPQKWRPCYRSAT